eukprot:361160-Chlamydomonas_euryale.AAC.5
MQTLKNSTDAGKPCAEPSADADGPGQEAVDLHPDAVVSVERLEQAAEHFRPAIGTQRGPQRTTVNAVKRTAIVNKERIDVCAMSRGNKQRIDVCAMSRGKLHQPLEDKLSIHHAAASAEATLLLK